MFKILKRLWQPKERRKHGRVSADSVVKFRILDSKNPAMSSRMLQGKILDISEEGLCIGTNIVQIDGLHIFHPTSRDKNKLEIEVELHPDLLPLRALGEVRWYSKVQDDAGWIFKVGVSWLSLSESDYQTLKNFLKTMRE